LYKRGTKKIVESDRNIKCRKQQKVTNSVKKKSNNKFSYSKKLWPVTKSILQSEIVATDKGMEIIFLKTNYKYK
jgi:hypothetical protein